MLKKFRIPMLVTAALFAGQAQAVLFDQNITPEVIFGSGNTNGDFTVDRSGSVELGLRAKIPFVGTRNSNGDGTYSYSFTEQNSAIPGTGAPAWNFDWTVNTDFNNSTGLKIDDLTYELGLDFDPSVATNFLAFDPIAPASSPSGFFDHSIGTNVTGNGAGVEATSITDYATLIANNNVLQQSWRYAFFAGSAPLVYDPNVAGTYDVYLKAFSGGTQVASTSIQVLIAGGAVPEPMTLALFGLGLLGIGVARRKKR